jgi:subtilisin family serine protease
MADFIKILAAPVERYRVITWYGQPVYSMYPRLKSYVARNLGEQYAALLAMPQVPTGSGQIAWLSDQLGSNAVPLASLPADFQKTFEDQLFIKLKAVLDYAQKLLESEKEEDIKWGQLIKKAYSIPDFEHVFVEGDKIVLAGWGFLSNSADSNENLFDLNLAKQAVAPLSNPNFDDSEQAQESKNELKIPEEKIGTGNDAAQVQGFGQDINASNSEIGSESVNLDDPTEKSSSSVQDAVFELTSEQNKSASNSYDTSIGDSNDRNKKIHQNHLVKESEEINFIKDSENTPPPEKNSGAWFFARRRNWWWLLLLLLLLFLLIWLLRSCNTATTLPPVPGVIVPIDSSKIVSDPDSIKFIVSDRLNIILTGKNNNIFDFARAFKNDFPDADYQIIYYDTLTHRVQIEIPAEVRAQLRTELPQKMSAFPMIVYHEEIFSRKVFPNDPGFNDNERSWYFKMVKADGAWDNTYGQKNIIVAILDDGFDLAHPELSNNVFKPWNVTERSTNVHTYARSIHGTHVAGTAIGTKDNNNGVAGIAPDCRFMPVQVSDRTGLMSTTAIIDGILYAIYQGAHVINLSLGMQLNPAVAKYPKNIQQDIIENSFKEEEAFWDQIFEIADSRNVTIVMAAGNQDLMIGIDPMQRNPSGIKVSAVDINQQRAGFSNYGQMSTISAPGVHIFNSVPNRKFAYLDGTSMASPIVAGGIALIKSINPDITNAELIDLLQSTGIPLNAKAGKNIGNLLQLDEALAATKSGRIPTNPGEVDCPEVQTKIDSFLQEIERLRELCPDESNLDTMKMPTDPGNLEFSTGRWKSTTSLNNDSGEKVTIYFDFYQNGKGKITFFEPDQTQCIANLSLSLQQATLQVNQLASAECMPPPRSYFEYGFTCKADANGYAECVAQNKQIKANRFRFRLVKIN